MTFDPAFPNGRPCPQCQRPITQHASYWEWHRHRIAYLVKFIESTRKEHYHVEDDPFYCCPLCEQCKRNGGGTHSQYEDGKCHCDAEKFNQELDTVLEEARRP